MTTVNEFPNQWQKKLNNQKTIRHSPFLHNYMAIVYILKYYLPMLPSNLSANILLNIS